jgi:predicted Fe-Mo cluster-binding NifX family protein
MRIAVTYENGEIFQHFGHTELFRLYDVEDGRVVHRMTIRPVNAGHEAMAAVLKKAGADLLICGGIGSGAQQALETMGIRLCAGVSGSSDAAVERFLRGTLNYTSQSNCTAHDEEVGCGHDCGHDCGH